MGAGSNIGAAIAGFSRGFSNQLAEGWQRQREARQHEEARRDREFQTLLPIHLQLAQESGDYRGVEDFIGLHDPEMAKRLKKDMPLSRLAPLFNWQQGGQATSAAVPPATTTSNTDPNSLASMLGQEPPTPTETLPSRNPASPDVESPGQRPGSTFFGTPVLNDREKQFRDQDTRRRLIARSGMTPSEDTARYVATGQPLSATQRQSAEPFQAVMGVDAKGNEVAAVFDQAKGQYLDQITRQPIEGFHQKPAAGATGALTEFDKELPAYAASLGKDVKDLTFADRLALTEKLATAKRAPSAASAPGAFNPIAVARLAARQPDIIKGDMSAGERGAVMSAIASDPVLRTQYEQKRMEPIRQSAQTVLDTIKQLVAVDPQTGKPALNVKTGMPAALNSGASQLFGNWTPVFTRGLNPNADATDANAALQQLTGQLVLNTLAEMKAQSKTGATGFGQLNVRELDTLLAAATQLTRRLTKENALAQLGILYEKFNKVLQPSLIETPQGGAAVGGMNTTVPAAPALTLESPVYIGPNGRPSATPPGAP